MRALGAVGWLAIPLVAFWLITSAQAQSVGARPVPPPPGVATQPPDINDGSVIPDPRLDSLREQQQKARNDDRQKHLVEDTDKLYELATELKTDVGKTNKDTLSIDVVKKADEIEKLAHSVKEKMKGS